MHVIDGPEDFGRGVCHNIEIQTFVRNSITLILASGRCPPSQQDRLEGSRDRKANRAAARPRGRSGAGHHPDSVVQVNQSGDASRQGNSRLCSSGCSTWASPTKSLSRRA